MKQQGYTALRNGMRFAKLVTPRGGIPTHNLTGKVIARDGDDLVVVFDDQKQPVRLREARQQFEQGKIRRQQKPQQQRRRRRT